MRVYASAEMTLTDTNDGISVTGIDRYYMASSYSSGITVDSSGWKPNPQETNSLSRYHWSYEVVNYSSGPPVPSKPAIIGVYGKDGVAGKDSIVGYLTNEAIVLPANSEGIVSNYELSEGYFKVYEGLTEVSNQADYSEVTGDNITINLNTVTGQYVVTNMEKSQDEGYFDIKAIYKGVEIIKRISVTKSKQGVQGEKGFDAKILYLSATGESMTFNANNTPNPATQTISFTANLQNTTGTATFTATPYNGTTAMTAITLGGSGNTRTLTQSQFPATATRILVKATLGNLTDTISVMKLKNGEDGENSIVGYLTNESVTLGASSTGAISSFTPAKGTFRVFDGIIEVTTNPACEFRLNSSTGVTLSINSSSGVYTVTKMSDDTATAEFQAVYKGITITKSMSLSKSRVGEKGDPGEQGPDGISPIVGFLTNESITLPASDEGVVPTSSFASATGTLNVYEGTVLKNAQAEYFVVSQSSITVSINTTTGVYKVTAMTTGASVLSGTATLRAKYGGVTIDKILTVTKALAGSQGPIGGTGGIGPSGKDATSYWINASVNAIKKDATGTIVPKTITFSGFSKTGTSNPVAYAGRFIIQTSTDGTSYTNAYTSNANQSSYAYTIPATASFVKARYYLAGGTTVLLDEQTVPVLVDAEGIEIGGRNLLLDTDKEFTNPPSPGNSVEFISLPYNFTPIFEENGINSEYTVSFDLKSYDTTNMNTISVYPYPATQQVNTYTFPAVTFRVTEEYKRYSMTFTPKEGDLTKDLTRMVFYGQYKTGNIPFIRRVKVEKGNIATDWTPAPEDVQEQIGNKVDIEVIDNLKNDLNDYTKQEDYLSGIGEVNSSLESYKSLLETIERDLKGERDENGEFVLDADGNPINVGAIKEIEDIVDRETSITRNLGELAERWNFIGTNIIMASEGLLIGETGVDENGKEIVITGIRISKNRVDFVDNKIIVAHITGSQMKINRAIFVDSITVGEHKIETLSGGHTTWTWVPKI